MKTAAWPFACSSCRGDPLTPDCTWCDGSGTVHLSPAESLVFERLYMWNICHARERPAEMAVYEVRGETHGSRYPRLLRAHCVVDEKRAHWLLERAVDGMSASEAVEFVRSVGWLECRGEIGA